MERQDYNELIINILSELIDKFPDQRFGQILVNSGVIELQKFGDILLAKDPFNEESKTTFKRMSIYR